MTYWYNDPAQYTSLATIHGELRVARTIKAHDALVADAAAAHNAAVTALRMPFAFTANQGAVLASRIA